MSDETTPLEFAESDRREFPIFTNGRVDHPKTKGSFEVNDAFYAALKRYLDVQRARGYAPPIMRQHGEDGLTYGRVLDLIRTDEGINAEVEFAKGMAKLYDEGFLDSWSPSFYERFVDPHDGEEYAPAFRELSFVSVRQLKNLPGASPHYMFSEDGAGVVITINRHNEVSMSETNTAPIENEDQDAEKSEDGPSMGERVEALEASMAEFREYMERQLEEKPDEGDEPEDEPADEPEDDDKPVESSEQTGQIVALSERVAELEGEITRRDVRARLGAAATDERVERLAKLKAADAVLFEQVVTELAESVATPTEIGSGAPAPSRTNLSESKGAIELAEQAKRDGLKRGREALGFLRKHGVTGEAAADACRAVYE